MPRKYRCVVTVLQVEYSGQKYTTPGPIGDPNTIVTYQVPTEFIVTRLRFSANYDRSNPAAPAQFIINTSPPAHTQDGVICASNVNNAALPSNNDVTFETFQGEQIAQTFYIANVSEAGTAYAFLAVICEGYNNE